MTQSIAAKDLQLGDVVQLPRMVDSPWSTAIVKRVGEDTVTFFRPYGTTADFSYTGGVICYTGIEEYNAFRDDMLYLVYQRAELK